MLIYREAREQSPEAANALSQIEIAGGLWRDRWPKVRLSLIYLLHMTSPLFALCWSRVCLNTQLLSEVWPWPWLSDSSRTSAQDTGPRAPLAVRVSNIAMLGQRRGSSKTESIEALLYSALIVFLICFFERGEVSFVASIQSHTHMIFVPFRQSCTPTCCLHLHVEFWTLSEPHSCLKLMSANEEVSS